MTEARSKQRYDWRQQLMRTKSSAEARRLRALLDASLREEAEAIAALDKSRKVTEHTSPYLSRKY